MTPSGEVEREDTATGGRYVLRANGAEAELTFTRLSERRVIADHTAVPDAMRGQGAGLRLARRLVADMRAAGVTVVALCPFVKAQARRHPDWRDVIE